MKIPILLFSMSNLKKKDYIQFRFVSINKHTYVGEIKLESLVTASKDQVPISESDSTN